MKLDRILVIADRREERQTALLRGIDISRRTGAELRIVGFTWHPMADASEVFDVHQRRELQKALVHKERDFLLDQLRDAKAQALNEHVQVVFEKSIHTWVTRHVEDEGFDLVIKSAHRSRTLTHTPTDWHLLRGLRVPVMLAIRAPRRKRTRVLATVDVMRTDRAHKRLNARVLDAAHTIAKLHDAEVHVCFSIEAPEVLADLDIVDKGAYARKVRKVAEPRLKELCDAHAIPADRVHMPIASASHGVNGVAHRLGAELLVLGTTARTGIKGFAFGNTAERVLAEAKTDILTVHA